MILLFLVTCPLIWKNSKKIKLCKENGNSLNIKKCTFMVCSKTILRFIVSKEGKTPDPKKIEALVKMAMPKTP